MCDAENQFVQAQWEALQDQLQSNGELWDPEYTSIWLSDTFTSTAVNCECYQEMDEDSLSKFLLKLGVSESSLTDLYEYYAYERGYSEESTEYWFPLYSQDTMWQDLLSGEGMFALEDIWNTEEDEEGEEGEEGDEGDEGEDGEEGEDDDDFFFEDEEWAQDIFIKMENSCYDINGSVNEVLNNPDYTFTDGELALLSRIQSDVDGISEQIEILRSFLSLILEWKLPISPMKKKITKKYSLN